MTTWPEARRDEKPADAAGAVVAASPLNIIFGETRLAAADLLWATTTVQTATSSVWLRGRVR